jgi:hypothetical protein
VAGEALPVWQAMENVAAEVLSAFPLAASEGVDASLGAAGRTWARRTANGCAGHGSPSEVPAPPVGPPPAFLAALTERLDTADAFELDARLRRAVALEQRLESELGQHLLEVVDSGVRSMEAYAREQLGISPRKARGLLRIARVAAVVPELHAAWSAGRLSWVRAQMILPQLALRPEQAGHWIERAVSVTVRRLEEDVEAHEEALVKEQNRQPGAQHTEADTSEGERCEIFWLAPMEVARLDHGRSTRRSVLRARVAHRPSAAPLVPRRLRGARPVRTDYSKVMTLRATSPAFILSKAVLISSRPSRAEIISSRRRRPSR